MRSHPHRGRVAHYAIDFDSHEAYGAFMDAVMAHEWWAQTMEAVAEGVPGPAAEGHDRLLRCPAGVNWWLRMAWQT